ncbi:MAG: S1 RNA-binding domain-containing protein, partial [Candidatus Heimdallarchaeota archaeon]
SKEAIQHISGLNAKLANRIIEYRKENGLDCLNDILKIAGIGQVTFDQAVGFLRLKESEELLDTTLIHPDQYPVANAILTEMGLSAGELKKISFSQRKKMLKNIDINKYSNKDLGISIVDDIRNEILNLGIDPRGTREFATFDEKISSIEDLKKGKIIEGVIRNVVDFGAFVDIGIKDNGLIHISNLSDRFITDIHTMLKIGDKVKVEILDVDPNKRRIALRLIMLNGQTP